MSENKELEVRGTTLLERATSMMTITSHKQCEEAGQLLGLAKDYIKAVLAWNKPIKSAADEVHSLACAQEKRMLDPGQQVKDILNPAIGEWGRKLREEERKVREAEAKRLQAEADAEAEREEQKALERARCLEAMGDNEASEQVVDDEAQKAEELKTQAATAAQAVMTRKTEVPKIKGVQIRTNWECSIENPSEVPREFLIPDEKAIRAYVRKHKEAAKIPGVKTWPTTKGF